MTIAILKPIVEDFLRERGNKTMPSSTAARVLHKRHPAWFLSSENARNLIRAIRGEKKDRMTVIPDLVRTKREIASWKNRFPKPLDEGFQWHNLPTTAKRWLILADIHIPYYAKDELIVALEHGREKGCDGVLYLGDTCDCYQMSDFCRDPRMRSFAGEAEATKEVFDWVNDFSKPKAVIWKLGTHEERYEKYLYRKAPELLGLPGNTFEAIFGTKDRGIEIIPATHPIRHKSLTLLHGHEYKGGFIAPVNPARGMFLRANESVVSAHQHKTSEHTEQTVLGKIITCWSVGALCNLHPKYSPLNKWNSGFAYLETNEGKYWKLHNKRIIGGNVV